MFEFNVEVKYRKSKKIQMVPLGFNLKIDENARLEEMMVDLIGNLNFRSEKWLMKNNEDRKIVMTTIGRM